MAGTYSHPMAKYGSFDDTMIAHVAPGEQIVPKPILDSNPQLARLIAHAIMNAGLDPASYRVGGNMGINEQTGIPEFGFFKKFFRRGIGRILKAAAPVALGLSGVGPLAAVAGGAGIGALGGGGLKGAVTGGLSAYGGDVLGTGLRAAGAVPAAGVVGPQIGTLAGGIKNVAMGVPGAFSALSAGMSGTTGKILQAAQFGAGFLPQKQALAQQRISDPSVMREKDFVPKRAGAMSRPASLNELAMYSPEQERSALATRGVNTGLGAEEEAYYRNLLNRSLIGDKNKVTAQEDFLMPIESQYFSRTGKNTSDVRRFLQGIA